MDKLRAMTTFVAIADGGSLTAAADRLGVSLPSVVRSLAGLEKSLGVRLLNRTTRRSALTDEGREYLERCRRVLAEVEEAEAALNARQRTPRGSLAVTSPVMFGRLHVAPLIAGFLGEYPEMRVDLYLLDRVVNVVEEGLDAALRIAHLADSSLVAIPVGATRRVVCASPDYVARRGVPTVPEDLEHHACVRFTGLSPTPVWELGAGGKVRRVAVSGPLTTNQVDAAIDAVAAGLGCGMFLCYQVEGLIRAGRLQRLLAEHAAAPVPIHLVYPQGRLMSARVRALADWLVPRLRERLGARAA